MRTTFVGVLVWTGVAVANPEGGTVMHGVATITAAGPVTTIQQATDKAILHWQSFSNAGHETVQFQQPSVSAVTLNRVTGAERSVIDGALNANGRVFLLNPNGVVIGRTGRVNVAGLLVSTLDMADGDFLAGRHHLKQDPTKPLRAVVNQGEIRAAAGERVVLAAPVVANEGVIQAERGSVALAAGTQVSLDEHGLVTVAVREGAPRGVEVGADAVGPALESVVNNSHLVEAGQVRVGANGHVELMGSEGVAVQAGTIDVDVQTPGSTGGRVKIASSQLTAAAPGSVTRARGDGYWGGNVTMESHERVAVLDHARVDVAGRGYGGGGIRIEGGRGAFVAADATVNADALERGDGGSIIVKSGGSTKVLATLSARGGARSQGRKDQGGFVETSGRQLDVRRAPDIRSDAGVSGQWLIDPSDIRIVAGTGGGTSNAPFVPDGEGSAVGVDLIKSALTGNATVVVQTGGEGSQSGRITLEAPLDFDGTGTNTLRLVAHDAILVDGRIHDSVPGGDRLNIDLFADTDAVPDSGRFPFTGGNGSGAVTLKQTIASGGGDVRIRGVDIDFLGGGIDARVSGTGNGAVTLLATGTGIVDQLDAASSIRAETLHLLGNAHYRLTQPTNDVGYLAATISSVNAFNYTDASDLTITSLVTDGVTSDGIRLTESELRIIAHSLVLVKGIDNGDGADLFLTGGTARQVALDSSDRIRALELSLAGPGTFVLDEPSNRVSFLRSEHTVDAVRVASELGIQLGFREHGVETAGGAIHVSAPTMRASLPVVSRGGAISLDASGSIVFQAPLMPGGGAVSVAGLVSSQIPIANPVVASTPPAPPAPPAPAAPPTVPTIVLAAPAIAAKTAPPVPVATTAGFSAPPPSTPLVELDPALAFPDRALPPAPRETVSRASSLNVTVLVKAIGFEAAPASPEAPADLVDVESEEEERL